MVDENRAEGLVRNFGGKVQDAVGDVTGDASTQWTGKANQAAGEVQKAYGQVVDEVRDFTADQPFGSLLAAMGLGIVVGFLIARH